MTGIDYLLLGSASFVNAAAPGPCIVLTLGCAARRGVFAGLTVSSGIVVADLILSLVAIAALLGAIGISEGAIATLRWTGIAALTVIGVRMLGARPGDPAVEAPGNALSRGDFLGGLVTGLSSPFNLVFLVALLPQFVPSDGIGAAEALACALVFAGGGILAQGAATLVGACANGVIGCGTVWPERAAGVLLLGFAAVMLNASVVPG